MPSAQRAGPSWTGGARTPPPAGQPSASGSPTAWLLHRPWAAKASTLLSHQFLSRLPWQVLHECCPALPARSPQRPSLYHLSSRQFAARPGINMVSATPRPSRRPREISCNAAEPFPARSLSRLPTIRRCRRLEFGLRLVVGGTHRGKQRSRLTASQLSPPQKPAPREAAAPLRLIRSPRRAVKTASGPVRTK